ncbi:MAG TPA: glycosyltransferase family 2 protein [Mycobacteriales bacterium]|nr:glycosyltransferase family 2 protein [Mycobacteriales bacterium]
MRVVPAQDLRRGPTRVVRPRTSTPAVTLVVPTLNEERNLPWVLARVPDEVSEIIVVDGRSTDATVDVALAADDRVRVVLERRRGKGAALLAGFAAAHGDVIVAIDADGSMDPAELPLFVSALVRGYDFVKGSRVAVGGDSEDFSVIRRIGSGVLTFVANRMYGLRWSDMCYGYFAFWADVLPTIGIEHDQLTTRAVGEALAAEGGRPRRFGVLHAEQWELPYGDGFEIEAALFLRCARAQKLIAEVPSVELPRQSGVSNLHPVQDGWRVLTAILRERGRRRRPLPVPIGRGDVLARTVA